MSGAATKSEMVTRQCIHKYCCTKCLNCFIVKCISINVAIFHFKWLICFRYKYFVFEYVWVTICSVVYLNVVGDFTFKTCFTRYFEQFFDLLDASSHPYLFYFSHLLLSFICFRLFVCFQWIWSHFIIFQQ